MDDINSIIDGVIEREGGSKATNDPKDGGGRTQFGISEKANPQAWSDGKVTEEEARQIYLQKYVIGPGFHLIPPSHSKVQAQLIDFGVNSGPILAIQKLQAILNVKVDGVLGKGTLEALSKSDPRDLNNRLVSERLKMIGRVVSKNPSQLKFLSGWISRACEFLF